MDLEGFLYSHSLSLMLYLPSGKSESERERGERVGVVWNLRAREQRIKEETNGREAVTRYVIRLGPGFRTESELLCTSPINF